MTSLAFVGASQRGIPWVEWLIDSLSMYDYPGRVDLVNPKYTELLGQPCYPSVDALPDPPDVAVIAVGAPLVAGQVAGLIKRGCRQIVIISNGFGETGTPEGREREVALRDACVGHDVTVIGPNCVGFASFHDSLCAIAQRMPPGIVPGGVSLVSQSGGLTGAALGAFARAGLGVDCVWSIGNGTVFGLVDALRTAVRRASTEVVCAVVESIRDRDDLADVIAEARRANKTLAFLMLGRSTGGRGVAQSHTGMIVGEQNALRSWLLEQGVVIAESPDELVEIAAVLASIGRPDPARAPFVSTVSGGGAGLTADLAGAQGMPLAVLEPHTVDMLRGLLPAGAYIGNPLDISTGDVAGSYAAIIADPHVGVLVEPWVLPFPDDTHAYHWQRAAWERVRDYGLRAGVPVVIGSLFEQALTPWAQEFATRPGVHVSTDLNRTMGALARLLGAAPPEPGFPRLGTGPGSTVATAPTPGSPAAAPVLVAEAEARLVLERAGLPVVAGARVSTPDQAVQVAAGLRGPWVVKLALDSIAHKERVGGVRLGVTTPEHVRAACDEIAASATAALGAETLGMGYLVTEMAFGPELLVGAVRDALVGPTITVAVGGWAAESGAVFGTVVGAAGPERIDQFVAESGLAGLLGATRAAGLSQFLVTLAQEFGSGRLRQVHTVEINPLILSADGPVVVDALLVG